MSVQVQELEVEHNRTGCRSDDETPPHRILVVDDSPDLLEAICTFVEVNDCVEVIGRATNGSEAVDAVIRLMPDLVLMDVQMPVMSGVTAATLIHAAFPEIPIVLMSADASYGELEITASGAAAFIDKLQFVRTFPGVLKQLTATKRAAQVVPSSQCPRVAVMSGQ